jgi:hypothetical protein
LLTGTEPPPLLSLEFELEAGGELGGEESYEERLQATTSKLVMNTREKQRRAYCRVELDMLMPPGSK